MLKFLKTVGRLELGMFDCILDMRFGDEQERKGYGLPVLPFCVRLARSYLPVLHQFDTK